MRHNTRSADTTPTEVTKSRRSPIYAPGWAQGFAVGEPIDVSVCIANWNCQDLLRECLRSLLEQPQGVSLEVIVCDNNSADGSAQMVATEFPEVTLIRNPTNVGFSRANNQAAAKARGRYLFFLNNDTVVPALALQRLLTFAEDHPEVGMVGPRLRDPDGHLQISYRQNPSVWALLHRTLIFRWTGLLRRAYRQYRRQSFDPQTRRNVEVLMGAAVLMPRSVFDSVGQWDEGYTFGGEDIDLSLRVNRERRVVYLPDVEILHHGRVSSRQNVSFSEPNVAIGYARYLRTAGASPVALTLYKSVVTFDAPVQIIAKSGQWLWRSLRRQREKANKSALAVRGLWSFLTSSLGRFWRA
jgi:GT2 family glycosyltransferase